MEVAFFSARPYEISYFEAARTHHKMRYITEKLNTDTVRLARNADVVCVSPIDDLNETTIASLHDIQIKLIMIRASGMDNVDTNAADKFGIEVKCLPGYAPRAIAEHAAALLLCLNRKIHLAFDRVSKGNFSIDGLMGFNLFNKSVGIIGMGRVGVAFAGIMKGFGCNILATDMNPSAQMTYKKDVQFVSFSDLLQKSDIISLHCTLDNASEHMINEKALEKIKPGAFLINTARGKLVDTKAVLHALDRGTLGAYGADVYEQESTFFYQTFRSLDEIDDPVLRSLVSHPHALITSHQAFLTQEAMRQMASTLIKELTYYEGLGSGLADRLMI